MKIFTKKNFVRKIIITLLVVIMFNFTMPIQSQADFGGKLFKPIFQLIAAIADVPIGLLQHTMLNTNNIIDSVTLDERDINAKKTAKGEKGIWYATESDFKDEKIAKIKKKLFYAYNKEKKDEVKIKSGNYDGLIDSDGWFWFSREMDIPNILYCPEYIFSNRIAMLDVNFINPNEYKDANGDDNKSVASSITGIIANWYKAFRNVAIVGLLSILVYIGIRILIGATAQDKAKYKERLRDWIIGLCLLFIMHFIMAGVMLINETITYNLSKQLDDNMIYIELDNRDSVGTAGTSTIDSGMKASYFKTNYMGYIRLLVQSQKSGDAVAYLIMYIALVIFTIMFTITYLKRVLYMAFFTVIAPLVAMTYPLDKLADGHAQGFNTWFREYMMNALIQPIHLILYMVLMGNVMELSTKNPVYGIVALAFLIPAEKFIKKMFRFDKGETTSALGAVAGGALAMKGIKGASGLSKKLSSGKGGENNKIRTNDNTGDLGKRGRNPNLPSADSAIASEYEANSLNEGSSDSRPRISLQGIETPAGWGPTLNSGEPDRSRIIQQNINAGNEADSNNIDGNNAVRTTNLPDTNNGAETSDLEGANSQWRAVAGPSISPNMIRQNNNEKPEQVQEGNDNGQVRIQPVENIKQPGRMSRVLKASGKYMKRGVKRTAIKGAKTLGRGLKATPRFALKTAARGVGAISIGAVAAGAAVTSGDVSTGASMIGAGALIGSGLGGAVGGKVSDKIGNTSSNLKDVVRDSFYTKEERDRKELKQLEKFDKKWKKDENNIKYLREKGLNDERAKEFLNDSNTQRFLEADVTDINMIYNARKMMDESKGKINIDGAVARARLAKNTSDSFKVNDAEQNSFKENMKSKNSRLKAEDLNSLVKDIIKIKERH